MILGYWATNGKVPIGKEENRILYPEPPKGDYCAVFEPGSVVIVDIDDFNHKTGELEEPVRGRPRSEAVVNFLNDCGCRYNGIKTENGVHLEFRFPKDYEITGNKNNWYCPLGIQIEVKVTKPVELVKVNGIERHCFKGNIGNPDIDKLPPALYPLQKSKEKPFQMNFSAGDRNNQLSSFALHLPMRGISAKDAETIIRGMNTFFLDEPLDESEIDLILRGETIKKMEQNEMIRQEKNLSQMQLGQEVIDRFNIITVQGQMFQYKNGVYSEIDEAKIGSYIRRQHPSVKTSMKNEALDYIADMTFKEAIQEEKNLINVKNGFLKIGFDGSVDLQPHNKDTISFRQFNATYFPGKESAVLKETLNKFFDGDQEQIELFKQMLAYLMMNHCLYQKCFFFVGSPSSGKSKILNMITEFCGKNNVSNLTLKELDDRFRAANIVGKTANINTDLENARIMTSGNFKNFVTGDAVTLERKYGKAFSYVNTAKLVFASNQFPDFSRDSEGIHRRVVCFPCNHVFRKTDADFNPNIDQDLASEDTMSALLNMAVEGYIRLVQNNGFISTGATEEASEQFKREIDNVYRYLKECGKTEEMLLRDPIRYDSLTGCYPDYISFCVSSGEEPKSQREFSRTICNEFGFVTETRRVRGTNHRCQFFKKKQ